MINDIKTVENDLMTQWEEFLKNEP